MKTIVLTGSSKGIGLQISKALLKDNVKVIGLARTHPEELCQNQNYIAYDVDLQDLSLLESVAKEMVSSFEVDAAIFNAGIGIFKTLECFSIEEMLKVMHVNFTGHAVLAKHMVSQMKQQQHGRLIAIGSEASLAGAKFGSLYAASKFALKGFMDSLRFECQTNNIGVTSIFPGMVASSFYEELDFTHGKAPENAIEPEQVVKLIQFLLAQQANFNYEHISLNPMKKVILKK